MILREVEVEWSKGTQLTPKPSLLPCLVVLKEEEDEESRSHYFILLNIQ